MIRQFLKRSVEATIVGSGMPDRLSGRVRGRKLILAYHNVVPDGERPWGERALHIPLETFREQLDVLADASDIVSLEALLSEDPDPEDRPRVAITFDDAYRGALHAIRETLVPYQVPSTVFAPPGLLSGDGFWWDRLAQGLEGTLPGALRDHCLNALAGSQDAVVTWASAENLSVLSPPEFAQPAREQELLDHANAGHLSVESHTWSHRNLCALADDEALSELQRAREWTRDRGMGAADSVAYPYGLASSRVSALASQVGHRSGLLVQGGWFPPRPSEPRAFALPRLNVPSGLSPAGLRIRLANLKVP